MTEVCPKCGKPSASPPAEVYCVDCATEGWEKDAAAHRAVGVRPTAVDPRSGEVIDLANAPHEDLVEAFLILQDHERRAKEWRTAVEDELVKRHGDHRGPAPVGDFEVEVDRGLTRVWDVVELEEVVHDLVNRGLLDRTYAGVIVEGEPKVHGKEAARLLSRVSGDALLEIRRCFRWEQKGRARVKVTAPPQLTK